MDWKKAKYFLETIVTERESRLDGLREEHDSNGMTTRNSTTKKRRRKRSPPPSGESLRSREG
jgi:hypothetical protein